MMGSSKRVLIIGYFGERNTGDEAILTAMLQGLRSADKSVDAIVPTYGPTPSWLETTHGVSSFLMSDMDRMFEAVETVDLVLLGGGGLLHDIWHPRPETMFTPRHFGLTYYCGIPWLAARLGKPVMLYAVGVGPLLFEEGRDLVRDVARAAQVITVRDLASAELLRRLDVRIPAVEVTADPSWRLTPPSLKATRRLLEQAGLLGGSWLGVAVRNWSVGVDQSVWEEGLLQGIDAFAREHHLGVLFLPFQHGAAGLQDDVGLARRLSAAIPGIRTAVLEHLCTPRQLLGVVAACELMVSMRLHAFIFSCIAGTPTVALDYDSKVPLHAAMLDPAPPIIRMADLTGDGLRAALVQVWDKRIQWASWQQRLAVQMRQRARRNETLALSLLEHPPAALPRASRLRIMDLVRTWGASRGPHAGPSLPEAGGTRGGDIPHLRHGPEFVRRIRRVVRIVAPQFFDLSGSMMWRGGAERYLVELARVIQELGYRVEVVQPASGEGWVRYYRNLRVVGVRAQDGFEVEKAVLASGDRRPLLTIHLAFYTAGPDTVPPAIGISHGVYWDNPYYFQVGDRLRWHHARILGALDWLDTVVSVDTNTINWASTVAPQLAEKMVYLPNFVDLGQFHPQTRQDASRFVVLFPRRLVAPKGFFLMAEMVPDLLASHPEVDVHFVGQAFGEEEKEITRLVLEHPGRVRWYSLPPERMQEAYQGAALAVIPTLCEEGTALACLEAQACGTPVIVTRVGGLPELVLNEYNGLLVEPNGPAVRAAIERLILDRPLRARLAEKALETVQTFRLERWQARWKDILRTFLPAVPEAARNRARRVPLTAVFPAHIPPDQRSTESAWGAAQMLARKGVDTFWLDRDPDRSSPHPRLQILPPEDELYTLRPLVFAWEPEQESWAEGLEQAEVVRLSLGNQERSSVLWRTVLRPVIHAALKERRPA